MLRALRAVQRILIAAIIGIISIYLLVNIIGSVKAAFKRSDLEGLATQRIAAKLPALDSYQRAADALVGEKPGLSWVEQTCDFGTNDSGWMVNNYREVCDIAAISMWPAADVQTARRLAGSLANDEDDYSAPCIRLGWLEGDGEGRDASFIPAGVDFEADYPDRALCSGLTPTPNRRSVLRGKAPRGVSTTGYLVVVSWIQLLDEDIGCTRWTVLFCSNPFGNKHAFGELS